MGVGADSVGITYTEKISVVDPKLFFPDPDPILTLISDPDSDPDPACL
jgi:hypothetical protein